MRAIEEPERGHRQKRATPRNECRKMVISEPEPGCKQIQQRQKKAPRTDADEQGPFERIQPTDYFLIAFGAPRKHTPNTNVSDEADEKNNVPGLNRNSHFLPDPHARLGKALNNFAGTRKMRRAAVVSWSAANQGISNCRCLQP